jgi:cyclopropane-fatty-acyl-phospholipid synthase
LYPEGPDGRPSTTAWKDYDLGKAEDAIFELYCERASLVDGMNILELGCGWGSLSLFLAAKYPNSKVTGVSNSRTQKEFIMKKAKEEGIDKNLTIITANMVEFEPPEAGKYDRMMTVECFEHMKNYEKLFGRVSTWLKPGGKAFIHVFSHKDVCYHFEVKDESDWMTKYFFTGGTMPSHDLFLYFQSANFKIAGHWFLNGRHYANTLHAWLAKQDAAQAELMPVFEEAYGSPEAAKIWWHRWRVFYMACEELFAFGGGDEWGVSLFLFEKPE